MEAPSTSRQKRPKHFLSPLIGPSKNQSAALENSWPLKPPGAGASRCFPGLPAHPRSLHLAAPGEGPPLHLLTNLKCARRPQIVWGSEPQCKGKPQALLAALLAVTRASFVYELLPALYGPSLPFSVRCTCVFPNSCQYHHSSVQQGKNRLMPEAELHRELASQRFACVAVQAPDRKDKQLIARSRRRWHCTLKDPTQPKQGRKLGFPVAQNGIPKPRDSHCPTCPKQSRSPPPQSGFWAASKSRRPPHLRPRTQQGTCLLS